MSTHHADPAAPHGKRLDAGVSGADRRTLDALFAHPISHTLTWRDVVTLVGRIGSVDERSNQMVVLQIGDQTLDIHKPHGKTLTAPEVMDLRHFVERAGWSPAAGQSISEVAEAAPDAPPPGLIVVIDHHEARVYPVVLDPEGPERHAIAADNPQHLLHEVDHRNRAADHRLTADGNQRYYETIAAAVAKGGLIVVVSHGAGESNAGHELAKYLHDHHPLTFRRIVREVVADLPALTRPELLRIAREAFDPPTAAT